MDDMKALITVVINGQNALKEELLYEIGKLQKSLDSFKQETNERFEAIDKRFEAIDKRFEAIDKRFEAIDKRFETIDKRFEAIDKQFETMGKRFDAIDIRLDKLGAQIAFLEDDAPTREEHDGLAARVKKVEQHLKN